MNLLVKTKIQIRKPLRKFPLEILKDFFGSLFMYPSRGTSLSLYPSRGTVPLRASDRDTRGGHLEGEGGRVTGETGLGNR